MTCSFGGGGGCICEVIEGFDLDWGSASQGTRREHTLQYSGGGASMPPGDTQNQALTWRLIMYVILDRTSVSPLGLQQPLTWTALPGDTRAMPGIATIARRLVYL